MPHGARTIVAALVLSLTLGIPVAHAQSSAGGAAPTTWADPPARKTGAEKPAAEAAKAAPLPATPAAAPKVAEPASPAVGTAGARLVRPPRIARREAPARRRVAAVPRRTRVAVVPRPRRPSGSRVVAALSPARTPQAGVYEGYRPYDVRLGLPPGYEDDRLERLSAAQAAGYLVVRRRSVEFPDGRSLRVYRPTEDGSPF